MKNENNLIWIDLEMTGLNLQSDRIIEIATIVTDANLNILAEGPVFAVHQTEAILAGMDDWNQEHHQASGLVDRVRQSNMNEKEAERQTLEFLYQYVPANTSPICGNSVCTDRRFLAAYMPQLENYFHYRQIDVSTLKELAKRWAPEIYSNFKKTNQHLALADIKESILELKYYRKTFLCSEVMYN